MCGRDFESPSEFRAALYSILTPVNICLFIKFLHILHFIVENIINMYFKAVHFILNCKKITYMKRLSNRKTYA